MTPDAPTAAAAALLGAVDEPDWPRLLGGNARVLAAVLRDDPPDSLIDHVLADGDPGHLAELAHSAAVAKRRPDVADHLASVLPTEVAREAGAATQYWEYRHWETLLARRSPAVGLDANLPYRIDTVLAHSPSVIDTDYAIERHAMRLTEREQVRALATQYRAGGEEALDEAGRQLPARRRVREALRSAGGIDALIAAVDDTGTAITALRDPQIPHYLALAHAQERPGLDWGRIADAHREEPFGELATAALVARGDCPEALLLDFFATHPGKVAETAARLPPSLLSAKAGHLSAGRFLAEGRGADLIAHGRPASAILEAVGRGGDRTLTPFHALLGRLLARTAGRDPAVWRGLCRRLGTHRGTIAELCETTAPEPGPWPDEATGPRQAFRVLLDAMPTADQLALLPHLGRSTLTDLFAHGVWRREWLEYVVEHGTPGMRESFAHTGQALTVAQIQRLLDLDEPALTATLFGRQNMSVAQIEHVLSGRAFPGSVLPDAFKARLMTTTTGWHARHAIACADPELQRHILEHTRVHGLVPQLRLLLNVWDRHGRDAMLAVATLPGIKITTLKRVRDADAEELRAHLAERETAAWQLERLRMVHDFHRESHDWHYPEILADLDECPSGVRGSPGAPAEPPLPELAAFDAGATCAEVFAAHPQPTAEAARAWIGTAVATARTTWARILRHGRPAAHVLAAGPEAADLRELVGNLAPGALLLALEMLDGFAGTVPELLATARAVTGETT